MTDKRIAKTSVWHREQYDYGIALTVVCAAALMVAGCGAITLVVKLAGMI